MWWRRRSADPVEPVRQEWREALATLEEIESLIVELLGVEREFASGRAQAGGVHRRCALVDRLFEDSLQLHKLTATEPEGGRRTGQVARAGAAFRAPGEARDLVNTYI